MLVAPRAAEVFELVYPCLRRHQTDLCSGKARDGLYEPVLADSEREAVADLLQYLENVHLPALPLGLVTSNICISAAKPISSPANLFVLSAPSYFLTTSIFNEVRA